ncbi:MAG: hypothetical protein U1F10_04955 [Burkholderiales bacterium]
MFARRSLQRRFAWLGLLALLGSLLVGPIAHATNLRAGSVPAADFCSAVKAADASAAARDATTAPAPHAPAHAQCECCVGTATFLPPAADGAAPPRPAVGAFLPEATPPLARVLPTCTGAAGPQAPPSV